MKYKSISIVKSLIINLSGFLILFSCSNVSNETAANEIIKPKKITVAEVGRPIYSAVFEYNGNYITKITNSSGRVITINYAADNKVQSYKIEQGSSSTTNYPLYENNLLKQILTYTFTYNSNNQVIQSNDSNNFSYPNTFYLYDINGNVIQSNDSYSTFQFSYDNANNPFKNVFPQIDTGILWPWLGSLINNQTLVKEKLSSSSSFITKYYYSYEYNSNNYATKRIQKGANGNILGTVTYEY